MQPIFCAYIIRYKGGQRDRAPYISLIYCIMYIYISNVRNVGMAAQPMRVRSKKRYVPKTDTLMFAKAEQCFFGGNPTGMVGVNRLVANKQNVIAGRVEDKPRLKAYDQLNEEYVCVVNKQMEVQDKRFMYFATLNKALPRVQLLTQANNVFITNLLAVNELFSAILRAYGYTTEGIMQRIAGNKAIKKLTTLTVRTNVTFTHKGVTRTMYINRLQIKDSWTNSRGVQFNFAKQCVEDYKTLIKPII
jgi:hypothetical protein